MVELTEREKEKAAILSHAIEGTITNARAAKQLGLSIRQIQRAKANIRQNGTSGVIHKLKGKPSNHSLPVATKEQALLLIKEKYTDFKPSFATEKLSEYHGIIIHPETTRLWMIEEKFWKPHKQKQNTYRSFRPRKEYF